STCRPDLDSQLVDRSAGEVIEIATQRRICLAVAELLAQPSTRQPTGSATVGDDVRNRLAVARKRHGLASLDRRDDLSGVVAELADSDLHVRQCSTVIVCGVAAPDLSERDSRVRGLCA